MKLANKRLPHGYAKEDFISVAMEHFETTAVRGLLQCSLHPLTLTQKRNFSGGWCNLSLLLNKLLISVSNFQRPDQFSCPYGLGERLTTQRSTFSTALLESPREFMQVACLI